MTHLKVFFQKKTFTCGIYGTFAQVFTFEGQLSQIEFYSGKFSFAYRELWLASQKHVTLLTGVY